MRHGIGFRRAASCLAAAVLMLSSLCVLSGCGKDKPGGTPISVEYGTSYTDGSGSGGTYYSIALPQGGILGEDGAELTVRSSNGDGYEYSCLLGGDVLYELGEVIDGSGIAKWDGYDKQKKSGDADKSFTLKALYPDGSSITASGRNAFPRGWDKGSRALGSFFEGLIDEESIIAAGGDRVSAQTEQDAEYVPIVIELFGYKILGNSTASVTEYNGGAEGGRAVIPDEYNGCIVSSIEGRAFADSDIVSVDMGSYVTKIGESCFENCASLSEINLPAELASVPRRAFAGCTSLRSAVMPSMVQFIEPQAFAGCDKLSEVSLNEGLLSVGSQAFSGCASLESVNIPYSVTFIGEDAFAGCSGKMRLMVYPDSYGLQYAKENNIPYTEYKISGGRS